MESRKSKAEQIKPDDTAYKRKPGLKGHPPLKQLLYDQHIPVRSSYIYQQGAFHPSLIYMSLPVTRVGYKNKTKIMHSFQ